MKFKEIDLLEGNEDWIHPDTNPDLFYGDMLEDAEKMLESVPSFMRFFPEEVLVRDWISWKNVGEMDLERARYLLSTDDMLEEMLYDKKN